MNIEQMRAAIGAEPDVAEVIDLRAEGDGYAYFIRTPFETFPKFVIGWTDAGWQTVRHRFKCGLRHNAEEEWAKAKPQGNGYLCDNFHDTPV